jgi:hypothetical protein
MDNVVFNENLCSLFAVEILDSVRLFSEPVKQFARRIRLLNFRSDWEAKKGKFAGKCIYLSKLLELCAGHGLRRKNDPNGRNIEAEKREERNNLGA